MRSALKNDLKHEYFFEVSIRRVTCNAAGVIKESIMLFEKCQEVDRKQVSEIVEFLVKEGIK